MSSPFKGCAIAVKTSNADQSTMTSRVVQSLRRVLGLGLLLTLSACQRVGIQRLDQPPQPSAELRLTEKIPLRDRWIVSASEAQGLVRDGAVVLDAYGKTKGAVPVTWQQFSQPHPPHRGKLLESDVALTRKLQALGISKNRPVLVMGNPQKGWGEEGRIVWMLRSFGHPQAFMVDGGRKAMQGIEMTAIPAGDFVVQRDRRWSITGRAIQQQLSNPQIQIIDSRTSQEFAGYARHGESREGHIPGAKNLPFRVLLAPDGRLLPYSELVNQLKDRGINPSAPVIVYCTGGIRSGWLTAVLVSLGYQAQNYPGSMWAWSENPEEIYPVEK